jgi:hypothetical protein
LHKLFKLATIKQAAHRRGGQTLLLNAKKGNLGEKRNEKTEK